MRQPWHENIRVDFEIMKYDLALVLIILWSFEV